MVALALGAGMALAAGVPAEKPAVRADLIPMPTSVKSTDEALLLKRGACIHVGSATPEVLAIAGHLAECLKPVLGQEPRVVSKGRAPRGSISLSAGGPASLGDEGYELKVGRAGVSLVAFQAQGLFRGVQTLRQMLPAATDSAKGPIPVPGGLIRDTPRFPWRGVSLDLARSFYGPAEIRRFIDLMAFYKLNRLHLHLSDDQGWRIEIKSRPQLTAVSGATSMAGGNAGFLTQKEYAELVAYAQSRYILVIPEIDMPGHTNAALAAYPELNCDGVARPAYGGSEVGFSSLCIDRETTYAFVEDIVRELAAITPGPYLHIGGDEALKTPEAEYARFVDRVLGIVRAHGKQPIGWDEIVRANRIQGAIVQHWIPNAPQLAQAAVAKGAKLIMSPASKAYLDMKYTRSTALGQDWAGLVEVKDAYDWDPATFVEGVKEEHLLGVEAALWTETLRTRGDLDHMVFPRLLGLAEIAWSPAKGRGWEDYRIRLATHGARLSRMGVEFYKSPQIAW